MDSMESSETIDRKVSLKRLDLVLHKFTHVAIPLHLDLLNKHRENIRKFSRLNEWDRIHGEQVNASRTVQQLKADIWEVEKVRNQLRSEDLAAFDKQVDPVKAQALEAVHAFIEEHHEVADPTQLIFASRPVSNQIGDEAKPASSDSGFIDDNGIQEQAEAVKPVTPQQSPASVSSWRNLYHELLGLNHMIHTFHREVKHQQESVDSIQENLDTVQMNVNEGATHLGKATKLKAAMFPLTGALIGCVAAGPVGLLAGFKLGGLAAVGCGVIGYQGGRYLRNKQEQFAEVELQDLSKQKPKVSLSLPNLNNSTECDEKRTLMQTNEIG